MVREPIFFLLSALVILLVFASGCTWDILTKSGAGNFGGPSDPALARPDTPQITATAIKTTGIPAIVTTTQPVTTVQVTATKSQFRIFTGNYHWAEYRNNVSVTMPPNPRSSWVYTSKMERSTEKYEGSPAIHYKVTTISDYPECCTGDIVTITKDGRVDVVDTYYDIATNRFLKETRTETIKGVLNPALDSSVYYTEHCRDNQPCGEMGFEPFGEMNITLTDKGTEFVEVPAGTYPDARKYTGNFHDGTPITFWVAPGIPVPVQYQFPNKYLDGNDPFQSFELKAWG